MSARKLFLPGIAVVCFLFMGYHIVRSQQAPPEHGPLSEPPRHAYAHAIAAAGLVEARTENIKVGSPVPGVVSEVLVAWAAKCGRAIRCSALTIGRSWPNCTSARRSLRRLKPR